MGPSSYDATREEATASHMTENAGKIVYRSLHAPRENGGVLIEPAIASFAEQITDYHQNPPVGSRVCWYSKIFHENKVVARHELFKLLGLAPSTINQPIVMVGHQPQLFHPGVWMKNFVADRVAKLSCGSKGECGIAVNLIVDNDIMKGASIAVPSRETAGAVTALAFDASAQEMPYEERKVLDPEFAKTFVDRVSSFMPTVDSNTLIDSFWRDVTEGVTTEQKWGELFSQARGKVEKRWGHNLFNVELSRIVNTLAFARMTLEIIRNASGFAEIYNAALAEYRQVHGLRSRSHPAPDLEIVSEQEVEIPFWLWTGGSQKRKRTFLCRRGSSFYITDREGLEWSGDFEEGNLLANRLLDQVLSPAVDPTRPKLRPKALITTLFARAFLCDGFVHGIGGYKYDQVTEAIAERWGLGTLAPMQCATMTLRLPLPIEVLTEEEVRDRRRKLRDLSYHPERFLAEATLSSEQSSKAASLVDEKKNWLSRDRPEELRERHMKISQINSELAAMLGKVRERSEAAYKQAHDRFHAQQPWLSREFAAILFPEEMLKREFARAVGEP